MDLFKIPAQKWALKAAAIHTCVFKTAKQIFDTASWCLLNPVMLFKLFEIKKELLGTVQAMNCREFVCE